MYVCMYELSVNLLGRKLNFVFLHVMSRKNLQIYNHKSFDFPVEPVLNDFVEGQVEVELLFAANKFLATCTCNLCMYACM